MRIFDCFKKENRSKKIKVKDLWKTIVKLEEKGRHIKKEELLSVPDSELETLVMSWMWSKFNDDWENQHEIISSLPKPCQNIYSCRTVTDEINNGGLNQLFFNSTGQFAEMSIDGFRSLGANKISGLIKEATERYNANKHVLDKYKDGTLESFSESYNEVLFDDLDDIFFSESDTINYTAYIKEHIADFGD